MGADCLRARALCLASALLASASGCSIGAARPYAVVEVPGGRLRRVPVCVTETRIPYDALGEYPLAVFDEGETAVPAAGGYGGLSGSPVYGPDGSLIGGCYSNILPGEAGTPVALQPADELELGMALGRARGSSVEPGGLDEAAFASLRPGHAVGVFWLWGDKKAGVTGAVTVREGREVLALSHAVRKQETGPVLCALARTPVLERIREIGGAYNNLSGWDGVVGTVTYDGLRGIFARLGDRPPAVGLVVELLEANGESSCARSYWAAKDPHLLAAALDEARLDAMAAIERELLKRPGLLEARLAVDGGDRRTVPGIPAESLPRAVEALWGEALPTIPLEVRSIRLTLQRQSP